MIEIIDANLIIPWILWVILQWALLLAPAVVLRKYLGRPMSKRNAIGTGVAMAVFWTIVAVMIADELGIAPTWGGIAGFKAFPIVMAAWISVWLLRKKSIPGEDASLGMLDRIFKNAFPESDTPHLAPSTVISSAAPHKVKNQESASPNRESTSFESPKTDRLSEVAVQTAPNSYAEPPAIKTTSENPLSSPL